MLETEDVANFLTCETWRKPAAKVQRFTRRILIFR